MVEARKDGKSKLLIRNSISETLKITKSVKQLSQPPPKKQTYTTTELRAYQLKATYNNAELDAMRVLIEILPLFTCCTNPHLLTTYAKEYPNNKAVQTALKTFHNEVTRLQTNKKEGELILSQNRLRNKLTKIKETNKTLRYPTSSSKNSKQTIESVIHKLESTGFLLRLPLKKKIRNLKIFYAVQQTGLKGTREELVQQFKDAIFLGEQVFSGGYITPPY